MNLTEFIFALFAVFGTSSFWYFWTRFVYSLEDDQRITTKVRVKSQND